MREGREVAVAVHDAIQGIGHFAFPGQRAKLGSIGGDDVRFQGRLARDQFGRQAQLRFGRPVDITRSDADFMPLFLVNSYLGRHRESMGQLYQEIRAKRGLSYGAYSYAEHFEQDGWSNLARPGLPRRQQYVSDWVYPKSTNANFVIHIVTKMLA